MRLRYRRSGAAGRAGGRLIPTRAALIAPTLAALAVSALAALGALAGAAPAAAASRFGASSASPRTYGPTRAWGGTRIRSLAPVPRLPVAPAPPSARASVAAPPRDQILSNEFTYTQWAYVARGAWVYTNPSVSAPRITRLQWYTESGFRAPAAGGDRGVHGGGGGHLLHRGGRGLLGLAGACRGAAWGPMLRPARVPLRPACGRSCQPVTCCGRPAPTAGGQS